MTTHICELSPSSGEPESARELLWRHGLPEDVLDGALALHAQELAAEIRAETARLKADGVLEPHRFRPCRDAADQIDPTCGGTGSAAEEQPATAPRNALSAPQTAEPPAPGRGGHPGGENGPHTGTQRAELCRRFKAAITRRWDVAPFVIDEIVDDAVDCHLDLTGRPAGAPHPADEERRQRYADAVDQAPEARAVRRAMAVADAEQADLRARLEERTRQLGEIRTRTTELEARVNGELAEAEAALARVRALHHDWDANPGDCAHCQDGMGTPLPWPCPTIRALDAPQAGDDTTGATP